MSFLSLLSTVAYNQDGTVAPNGYIQTVSSGKPSYSSTLTGSGLTVSSLSLTASSIALGLSTTQSQTNFSNGSYAAGSWQTAKTGLTNVRKLATSSTGQYQLIVSDATSSVFLSSDSGVTWSSLGNTQGLPVLTGSARWVSGAISASGQNILLAVLGGSLWMSQDFGRTFATSNQPTPSLWFQLNGDLTDAMGGPAATATGSPSYITFQQPGFAEQAVNLANTAGGTATKYVRGTWAGAANFTVSMWVNPQTVNGTSQVFFSAYANTCTLYVENTNKLSAYIPTGGGTNGAQIGPTSYTVTANTWYYVTLIFQTNGLCSFYVNNSLVGSITNTQGVGSYTTSSFGLGTYDTATTMAFNGYIADLRLTNSVSTYVPVPHLAPNIWMPMENSTADLGSNGITPTVTGSVSYVPGVVGLNAVNLANTAGGTATNYVRGAWTAPSTFTASGWFNLQSYATNGNNQFIFTTGGTNSNNVILYIINGTNTLSLQIPLGQQIATNQAISLNTWYYFAFTVRPSGLCSLYLNNILYTGTSNATVDQSGSFYLGTYDILNTNAFNGYIDDFRIYNSAIPYHVLFPQNYRSVALSGTAQYALASAASGWVVGSSTTGQTWTKQAVCVGTQGDVIQPNKTGLAQSSWEQAGVNWVATASTTRASYQVYNMFNNPGAANLTWNSNGGYNLSGTYTGSASTTIQGGIGAILGEWVQVQSSNQIVLSSFSVKIGGWWQAIKTFYIVGSNDGTTWLPIQYGVFATNPYNSNYTDAITNLIINQSGVQSYTANITVTVTTTTYSTTTTPYIYFRIIVPTIFSGQSATEDLSISELYLNFAKPSPSALSLSYSGQYQLVATNSAAGNIMPNQTGLTTATWFQGGVQWTASASSFYTLNPPYNTFNNSFAYGYTSWSSDGTSGTYNSSGVYNGSRSTTILGGIGTVLGEWIQLQSSVPLVLQSYTYASGWAHVQNPRNYYLVGSMDGSNWYPLQYANTTVTPFTANNSLCTDYITINTTGVQPIRAGNSNGSVTTTSYSTSIQPYMYFRLICVNIWPFPGNSSAELGELYLNFQNSVSYSSNYGATWLNSSRTLSNEIVSLSPSGQYALSTNCVPPLARLTLDNTNVDAQGTLAAPAVVGSVTYSQSVVKVGAYSAFFNQTAGGVPGVYLNYTLPTILQQPPLLTLSGWFYPTALPASTSATPFGLNNGSTNNGSTCYISTSGAIGFTVNTTGSPAGIGASTTTSVISINTWYHIAIVFYGTTAILYLNSSQLLSIQYTGLQCLAHQASLVPTNFFIGSMTSNYSSFAGYVDDVRLYTQALSADEVNALYRNPALTQSIGISSSYLPITSYTEPILPNISANVVDAKVSQTGQYMVAVTSATTNNVYYSVDFGATFNALTIGSSPMTACSLSNDGSYLTVSNATTTYTLNANSTGYTLALGNAAGQTNQANNAIAIGNLAGQTNQSANSIVLNATGAPLNTTTAGFYVAPVQSAASSLTASVPLLGYGDDKQVMTTTVSVLNGGLYAPTDAIAQGAYLTPSPENRDRIVAWMTKMTNTVSQGVGSQPFWASGNTYGTISGAPGSFAYFGGVLLPDGRIVFVPGNATTIGIFNTFTNVYSTTGTTPGSNAYTGGVLLPDGRVVFVPYNTTTIGLFNPSTNTYSTIAGAPASGAYFGGVLLPDGRVVFVPHNATTIGLFNPSTNTYSTIAGAPGSGAYVGGVLLPDGRVVFVPRNATTIGLFNPVTNTYSTIAGAPGNDAYERGVLLSDGRVVFVPHNATRIGLFNPSTNTFSTIAGAPGGAAYAGGVLLPDGRVLFVPSNATTIGLFNPSTNTYSTIAAGAPGSYAYSEGILLPDGRVVFVPLSATTVGLFTQSVPAPREICLHPFFNKS